MGGFAVKALSPIGLEKAKRSVSLSCERGPGASAIVSRRCDLDWRTGINKRYTIHKATFRVSSSSRPPPPTYRMASHQADVIHSGSHRYTRSIPPKRANDIPEGREHSGCRTGPRRAPSSLDWLSFSQSSSQTRTTITGIDGGDWGHSRIASLFRRIEKRDSSHGTIGFRGLMQINRKFQRQVGIDGVLSRRLSKKPPKAPSSSYFVSESLKLTVEVPRGSWRKYSQYCKLLRPEPSLLLENGSVSNVSDLPCLTTRGVDGNYERSGSRVAVWDPRPALRYLGT
ncbi:hypothetical protein SISNIDRAFT_496484 [Sistotremastrum niveocremeum HHB9708]|uniref:Uncharacterized protein n=1 Tax=Sistotremastrum niveocremeum HHB9708 TaxID=1314777 RepID=A0A164SMF5_9AGAM|nr:hypothetical protein SISNIDRAFT_496484 [Sistotremastrum niveocremeum HHB9708]